MHLNIEKDALQEIVFMQRELIFSNQGRPIVLYS
jgi:hypothetical protein